MSASQPTNASPPHTLVPIRSQSEGSGPNNIGDFCERYRTLTGTKGMDDAIKAIMGKHLEKSEYTVVLRHLWDEPDQMRRLVWLREHHNLKVLHAPLFYELAVEELAMNPRITTLIETSLPLVTKARSLTDAARVCCLRSNAVPPTALGDQMTAVYERLLDEILEKHLGKTTKAVIESTENRKTYIQEVASAYRWVAEKIEQPFLPHPAWVGDYKAGSCSVDHVKVAEASEQLAWRRQYAKDTIKRTKEWETRALAILQTAAQSSSAN